VRERPVWNTDRMGRHSAADDDEDVDVPVVSTVAVDTPRRGRHASPDDDSDQGGPQDTALAAVPLADQETERLVPPETETDLAAEPTVEVVADPAGEPVTDPAVEDVVPRVGKGNQSTSADLELLRAHSDLRARVIAAVVAPFVIYTLAMYLAGALDVYFIWVWLPLVTAGVLAGSILDAAHRKRGRNAGDG
jgi:hypothetical protein